MENVAISSSQWIGSQSVWIVKSRLKINHSIPDPKQTESYYPLCMLLSSGIAIEWDVEVIKKERQGL